MIRAYAARKPGSEFESFFYGPGELGVNEVEVDVVSCGICHSDMSMWKNDWGKSKYPFVGGHEITGYVSRIGSNVKNLKIGDKVGIGWHNEYCNTCVNCLSGNHNLCRERQGTIVGRFGGFAEKVRAMDISTIKLPDEIDIYDAGPLLCAGITVFNPLVQFKIQPTAHVAILGVGGLGHLAIQFAKAWGCEVTAMTSKSKFDDAKRLGAHHCIDSRDLSEIMGARGRFDLIISTVNVQMEWNELISTLKPQGRLHFLGVLEKPINFDLLPMILDQISFSGSPVGAPSTLSIMMEFASRHRIKPMIEKFEMKDINMAFRHLESGKARHRIVLVNK